MFTSKHKYYISTALHGMETKTFKKAPERLIKFFELPQAPERISKKNIKILGHIYYVAILFTHNLNFRNWNLYITKYVQSLTK